jgi:hypothetical protein
MLLAPLIIAVAGIRERHFANREGGGSGETCGRSSVAHTTSKNPRPILRYKHILLLNLIGDFSVNALPLGQETNLVAFGRR